MVLMSSGRTPDCWTWVRTLATRAASSAAARVAVGADVCTLTLMCARSGVTWTMAVPVTTTLEVSLAGATPGRRAAGRPARADDGCGQKEGAARSANARPGARSGFRQADWAANMES